MTEPTIGSLFSGYEGLGMGVQAVIGGRLVWVSDIDPGACKVLAYRHPGVPNLGDITKLDWSTVPRADVWTGGSPCQDLSGAGRRTGMTEGTRSNLWVQMREGIAQHRPSLVIWENVRGAYSARADSALEHDERLLAGLRRRDGQPVLRALGRVLGDLSDLGYVGGWHGITAASVGAPHGRFRVFVVAAYPGSEHLLERWLAASSEASGRWPLGQPAGRGGAPTGLTLLPTPAVNDMGAAYTPDEWDAWTDRMKAEFGNGNGHGKSLEIEAQRLLPTPTTTQRGPDAARDTREGAGPNLHNEVLAQWGQYAEAVRRWEDLTRPAPAPTVQDWDTWRKRRARRLASKKPVGMRGSVRPFTTPPTPRLSPRFPEWMMGVPDGHVTDVPDITRNEALKLCGNGVVPQQAATAVAYLLPVVLRILQRKAAA